MSDVKNHLTFAEYIESKNRLREAIKDTPKQVVKYSISKYCRIVTGDSRDESEKIHLKPSQTIIVEWLYDDIDNPKIKSIMFEGVCESISNNKYTTYWDSARLSKWLYRNTYNFMK